MSRHVEAFYTNTDQRADLAFVRFRTDVKELLSELGVLDIRWDGPEITLKVQGIREACDQYEKGLEAL